MTENADKLLADMLRPPTTDEQIDTGARKPRIIEMEAVR